MDKLRVIMPGVMDYGKALILQKEVVEGRIGDSLEDSIIILEHPHTITIGKRGNEDNLLAEKELLLEKGVDIYKVERGGDITYHGYGQVVAYPVIKLSERNMKIHTYISMLEEVIIQLLKKELGITAGIDKRYPGVWVENKKIAAVGVAVRKYVTYHGLAFNVNTDLDYFRMINPCGIKDRGVTTLQEISGITYDMNTVMMMVLKYFKAVFGYR